MGKTLLGIYVLQCLLGAFIHYVKIPFRFGRPPQNYAHAILGLATIALAVYQVYTGFHYEWPNVTGRTPLVGCARFSLDVVTLTTTLCLRTQSNAVTITWTVWAAVSDPIYVHHRVTDGCDFILFCQQVLALLYFGGLAYLPRQWRQERPMQTTVQYRVASAESQEFNKFRFA